MSSAQLTRRKPGRPPDPTLPHSYTDRALIAEAMGLPDYGALTRELEAHRERVSRHFHDIFAASSDTAHRLAHVWQEADDTDKAAGELAALGYRQAQALAERLKSTRASARYRAMPAASQARLDRLVPLAMEAAAAESDADARSTRARPPAVGERRGLLSRSSRRVTAGAQRLAL